MKLFTFLILALTFSSSFAQLNPKTESEYFPGEVLVQVRNGYSAEAIIRSFPEEYELKAVSELSPLVKIWLFSFNADQISNEKMLGLLLKNPGVRVAQNNHVISERATMPNDPNTAANQWHHNNTGQTGGTVDADIDSDLAWDVTTGGLTIQGDTIVVCIVEGGGAYFQHPDLIENFWRNYQEIPNNSIDDDGNGYIDDFEGWRVDNSSDNHGAGNHGTQCMGMIGAKGDNNVGVVGANWNVKMMLVSGFSTSESSVIAAYNYPLTMRKIYNETNGTEGAFVVATSASWGIDNADPANYPLWCAMYDSLGKYGVLNPGATTNNNTNVDVAGDMPTACASPYMVSVTRTSETDSQGGGYGLTTIDFGAPGIDVYTTSSTNSYGTTTGTSFSCPLTAGVIGLMYSVPCNSLIALAKADPQAAADQILQALMDGVDPTAAMSGKSVTGGRLNSNNSIQLLLNNCSTSSCITPFGLNVSGVTDTDANFMWSNGGGTDFIFYIKEVSASIWDSVSVSGTSYSLTNLLACTEYQFMIRAVCPPSDTSGYSAAINFTTDGCCTAPAGLTVTSVTATSGTAFFNSVLAADSYNISYKPISASTWTTINTTSTTVFLTTLDSCTSYEIKVETICGGDSTGYAPAVNFNTTGCGTCETGSYCTANGNSSQDEFISNVSLSAMNHSTGDDGGYLYTGMVTDLYAGQSYSISLTPGFSGSAFDEYFVVWIDYNGNQTFETNETVFDSGTTQTTVNGTVNVPTAIGSKTTRMRVAMKYVGGSGTTPPLACGAFGYGEVEDYCINIIDTTSGVGIDENAVIIYQLYPNPVNDYLTIEILNFKELGNNQSLEISNSLGQIVLTEKIQSSVTMINTRNLSSGLYNYQLNIDGEIRKGKIIIQK